MSPSNASRRQWPLAVYKPVDDPAEAGNPYIEALPPIWTRDQVTIGLSRYLKDFHLPASVPVEVRVNKLQQIQEYYQPLQRDVDLAYDIINHLRGGYLNKNPIGPNFVHTLKRGIAAMAAQACAPLSDPVGKAIFVNGVSGLGKSASLRVILDCFTQVIRHECYQGQPFTTHQVVWLKVNCPKKGGVPKLCKNLVEMFDTLLGEKYAKKFAIGRISSDDLELAIVHLATVHGLGLLVIDEIQNLLLASPTNRAVTLAFLTGLMNGLGVPIVFVGTNGARVLMEEAFPTARRSAGSVHHYTRIKQGPTFEFFMTELWKYQLVEVPVPLNQGWLILFYKRSQGIPDIAVRLFVATQRRALSRSRPGVPSTITAQLVDAVWKSSFKLMHAHMARAEQGMDPVEPGFGDDLQRLAKAQDRAARERHHEPAIDTGADPEAARSAGTPNAAEKPSDGEPVSEVARHSEPGSTLSKAARARKLGAAATPTQLAAAANSPTGSLLADIVGEGEAEGLQPHKAIKRSGRSASCGMMKKPG